MNSNLITLQFGGQSKQAVVEAFIRVISGRPYKLLVLQEANESDLVYEEFLGSIYDAMNSFGSNQISSIQVQGLGKTKLLGSINKPCFCGDNLNYWSASIEGLGSLFIEIFKDIKNDSNEGLSYIALSNEESLDFEFETVTVMNFPWSHWQLIIGAVKGNDDEWVIKKGVVVQSERQIEESSKTSL